MNNLIFTNHARLRMSEYGLSEDRVNKLFAGARPVKIGFFRTIYKGIKYGSDQVGICYRHNGHYLLTICDRDNGAVLVTISRKPRSKVKYL